MLIGGLLNFAEVVVEPVIYLFKVLLFLSLLHLGDRL